MVSIPPGTIFCSIYSIRNNTIFVSDGINSIEYLFLMKKIAYNMFLME
jgi:hypothetical protein